MLLASHREALVLKAHGHGGKDVFLGRFTPEAEWREVAARALGQGGWVGQESKPYLYQSGDSAIVPWPRAI